MMSTSPGGANGIRDAAGGYGPPGGGGYGPPPGGGGGGGYGGPPPGGGGGYGGPPPGGGGGGGYGGPPGGGYGPPGGGGYGPPPGGFGGPPPGGFGGPPPGGFGYGPPGGFPPGGPMMPGAGGDVNTTLPIILSVLGILFCCGLAAIPHVLGLVFAIQANGMKNTGDIAGAQVKAKSAMTMVIVGFVLGLFQNVLVTAWRIAMQQ